MHTISLTSSPELEDPWLLALALAIVSRSRGVRPGGRVGRNERELKREASAAKLDRLPRTTIHEGKPDAIPTVEGDARVAPCGGWRRRRRSS